MNSYRPQLLERRKRRSPASRALAVRALALAAGLTFFTACATTNLGIRPNAPAFRADDPACKQFQGLVEYAQGLQEAYHTRATQNRWWIYVAGTLALGTTAATGGLAAAGAASLTISLLSISGGFTSGFFAFLHNSDLATIYTTSANRIAQGLQEARAALTYDTTNDLAKANLNPSSCQPAFKILDEAITGAQKDLELARTDAAAAAALRVNAAQQSIEKDSIRVALRNGQITHAAVTGNQVDLTVSGADLSQLQQSDVSAQIDQDTVSVLGWTKVNSKQREYNVSTDLPKTPANNSDRTVTIEIPKADAKIPSAPGTTLHY